MQRGEVWWAELSTPRGSEPGYRRPVAIVQSDAYSRSRMGTVVVVSITSNMTRADAPGNVRLSKRDSKLPRASVANVAQVLTLDRRFLVGKVGRLPDSVMEAIDSGLRQVLSL